jgi:hypothetical protein
MTLSRVEVIADEFELISGFMTQLRIATESNYSLIDNSRILLFSTAQTKSCQSPLSSEMSSTFIFKFLPTGDCLIEFVPVSMLSGLDSTELRSEDVCSSAKTAEHTLSNKASIVRSDRAENIVAALQATA